MYTYDYVDFEFDSNGDGFPDTYVEACDTNGDGTFDLMMMYSDTNGDGCPNVVMEALDSDNNGQYDMYQQTHIASDGVADVIVKAHDYNQDGIIDSTTTYTDYNHDGKYDEVVKAHDSNGDGLLDKAEVYVDATGTGTADYSGKYTIDPATGILIPTLADGFEIGGTTYTELENYQPNCNYPEGVSGDPAQSMTYWECQGDTNRCALYSQKFVIEELSPEIENIDIEEFAAIAKEHGWFTEDGGTTLLNMNNMLDYYGIENEMTFHNTIDDIEACLNNGGKVIVSIDSCEIWYGEEDNIFSPESCSNHAVEVIGIDRTDPAHPMVILNDSGTPNGRGEMIPLDVFEGAWEDGDCQMISCYPSAQ